LILKNSSKKRGTHFSFQLSNVFRINSQDELDEDIDEDGETRRTFQALGLDCEQENQNIVSKKTGVENIFDKIKKKKTRKRNLFNQFSPYPETPKVENLNVSVCTWNVAEGYSKTFGEWIFSHGNSDIYVIGLVKKFFFSLTKARSRYEHFHHCE
jgi:hypothetical protein